MTWLICAYSRYASVYGITIGEECSIIHVELFALCKDGNFNIHIWAWFRLFHLLNKGNQALFLIW